MGEIDRVIQLIEEFGGSAVCEPDMFVVNLARTNIADGDLSMLQPLRQIHILSLSETAISDVGLRHLEQLSVLESLSLAETNVTAAGIARLRNAFPNIRINTDRGSQLQRNPFTGKPFGEST